MNATTIKALIVGAAKGASIALVIALAIALPFLVLVFIFGPTKLEDLQRRGGGILCVVGILSLSSLALIVSIGLAVRAVGFRSASFAFTSACVINGFAAIALHVVPWCVPHTHSPFRGWERMVWQIMGVSLFGVLVRRSPLRYLNTKVYLKCRSGNLAPVHASVIYAEGVHFWALLLSGPLLAYAIVHSWWDALAWLVIFNALCHLYPFLNLRMVRARLEPVMRRAQPNTALEPTPTAP